MELQYDCSVGYDLVTEQQPSVSPTVSPFKYPPTFIQNEVSSKGSLHKEKFTEIWGKRVQIYCGCLIPHHHIDFGLKAWISLDQKLNFISIFES